MDTKKIYGSENRRKLYDNLSNDGFDLGTFEDFDRNMNDKDVRKSIHEAAVNAGWDMPDYGQFERDMTVRQMKIGGQMQEVDQATYDDFVKRHPSGTNVKPRQQQKPQQPVASPQAAGEGKPAADMPQLVREGLEKGAFNSRPVSVRKTGDPGAAQFGVPYMPDTQLTAAQRDEIYRQNDYAARQMQKMRQSEKRRNQPLVDTGIPEANRSVIRTQGQWEDDLQKGAKRISDSVVAPAVDKAIAEFDKKAHEVFESTQEGGAKGLPTGTAGGAVVFGSMKEANKAKDPDKILQYLSQQMEDLYKNEDFIRQISDEANRMGIDSNEYVENIIKPRIAEDIRSRFDKTMIAREMPKNGKEYVVSGLSNSIIGMLADAFLETKAQRAYKNQAEAMTEAGENPYYTPGTGASLTKMGVSFAADAPFFGVYGKVNGQVAKKIAEREIKKMMAKGLSESAARSVVGTALENSVGTRMKNYLMQHIASSALTLGEYNATSEIARQTRDKEGYDLGKLAGATVEGLATGAAFGATGAVSQALSQPLSGFAKLSAKAAGFGAEAGTLYTTEEMSKLLQGEEAFDNPFEGAGEAVLKLGVMKLSGPGGLTKVIEGIARPTSLAKAEHTGVQLSDATKNYIRNTVEGKNLVESLSQMHPDKTIQEVNGKKKLTKEGDALRQQLAQNYDEFMNNKDIPASSKQEVAQIFGALYRPGLETGADIIQNEDGSVIVKTRDKDGNCIQDLKFDNLEEAEQWKASHQSQCRRNDAVNMWNTASNETKQEIVNTVRDNISGKAIIDEMKGQAEGMRQNRLKRQLDKINQVAEQYEGREMSDEEARNFIQTVIRDGDEATFDEIYQLIREKAYPEDMPDTQRNYWEGQQLSPVDRHFAQVDAQVAEERLMLQGEDFANEVMAAAEYPDEKIAELAERLTLPDTKGGITTEQFNAAVDYYNKISKVNGMFDEALKSVDNKVAAANAYVRANTHTDSGSLISATCVEYPERNFFVTAGHFEVMPDGKIRPTDNSGMVILRDKATGEIQVVNPSEVMVDNISDSNRIIAENDSMEGLRGQLMQEADNQIELHPDTPDTPQEMGEVFTGQDGRTYMVTMEQDQAGNVSWLKIEVGEDGSVIGAPEPLDMAEYRQAKSNEIDAMDRPQAVPEATDQVPDTENTENYAQKSPEIIPENQTGVEAGAQEDTGVDEAPVETPTRIAVDDKGRKLYETAKPEDTMADLVAEHGEEKARRMVSMMADNTMKALTDLQKKDTSGLTDMNDIDAHEKEIESLQNKYDYWNNLRSLLEPEKADVAEVAVAEPDKATVKDAEPDKKEPEKVVPAETPKAEAVKEQPVGLTAEQKVAQGTVKNNIGKRLGFQNQDGTRSEIVIDSFKGDDMVEVTRYDFDADGKPVGEPYKQDLRLVDVSNSIVNGMLKPVLSVEDKLRQIYKGKPGMQNIIDVLTDEERRNMLSAVERGDQEALREMTNEYVESHREDIILNERDKRNAAVSRIMDGGGSREDKLRRVRKEYQGYDDAVIALSDEAMRPTTLEEYVSDLHSRQPKSGEGPLAYFSYDVDGNKIVGMQDESGHGTKTGGDTKGYAPWLAPKGKGMSLQRYAETVHEQLPEAVKEQYSDQDVRNAILSVFGGAERPSDITTMTLRRGILQAEQAARRMEEQWIDGPSYQKAVEGTSFAARLQRAVGDVNTEPTEGQKEAGNYKKGHMSFGGYDYTIENPAGSVRRGKDAAGREWEQKMNNTYGYILGKYGKDGDHLDMFINDGQDLDNWNGTVYVVDQVDPRTGKFDEHKVMYGFDSLDEAKQAYLSNYEEGWQGLGKIVGVTKEGFDKWLDSSKRKLKEFADHSIAKEHMVESEHQGFDSALKQLNTRGISINDPDLMKEYGLTDLTLSKTGDHVTLNKIVVENKGQGNGTRFMEDLARLADEKGWTLALTPSGSFGAKSIKRLKDFYKRFGFVDNKGRNPDYQTRESMIRRPKDYEAANTPEQQEQILRDAVVEHLRSKGIDVSTDWKLGQKILDDYNGVGKLSASKKRAVETASLNPKEGSPADISTADGAKIQKKLESYANKLEKVSNLRKNFLEELAKELGATSDGSKSKYATFITKNGDKVTIRLGNHNATVSNFDYRGEDNGISIVVSRRENEGVKNNGIAHIVEAFYPEIALRKAYGKPLSEIVRSINEALNSGKYNDTTGLAEMEEVNADEIKQHKVYHGSGAEFDAFDHSHIGEGAGSQSFGYGTYVSAGQSVAEGYAHQPTYRIEKEKNQFIDASHAYGRALTALDDAKESGVAVAEATSNAEKAKKEYEEAKRIYEEAKKGYLYDVEIPGENEAYYIDYQGKMDYQKDLLDMVDNALTADGWKRQEIDSRTKFTKGDKQIILTPNQSGADLYAELEDALGSDKAASDFLYKTGITGMKYPAGTILGGGNGATNYVIFNESDAKITGRTKFFKTPDGHAYGYTYNGKIYVDPRIATTETPIHEYGHLWCEMKRETAPEEWKDFKQVMLNDKLVQPIIDKVKSEYPELTKEGREDDFVEEIITQFSGKRGNERLHEIAEEIAKEKGGIFGKAEAVAAMNRLKSILNRFWAGVAKMMGWKYTNANQIADRIMADMLNGLNLSESAKNGARYQLAGTKDATESEIMEAVSRDISPKEIEQAMNSGLVKQWLSSGKGVDSSKQSAFNLFGAGTDYLRAMAKARLGITNKYHVSNSLFNNAVEGLESLMSFAKEKGLDPAVADKYNLKDSETIKSMLDSDKPVYSDKEVEAILKVVPKAKEALEGMMQAFADENKILDEIDNLRNYDNGEAVTKAFAIFDIAKRRLRDQYYGDERFYRPVTYTKKAGSDTWSTDTHYHPDYQPKEGEEVQTRYLLKSSVANDLLSRIATAPINDRKAGLPKFQKASAPTFYSNAEKALEGINQEKATPEQWLAMITKNGGMKAGEDKWLGLSDWLKSQDKKSLTKQEVIDYIRQNQIQVEDVNYEPNADERLYEAETTLKDALQDEFDYNVDEIREQRPDEIYMQDIYDEALERLRDRLGYTEETSPFEISGATISYKGYREDNHRKKLRELASKLNMTSNVYIPEGEQIDDTRLSYTTHGLDHKREIALTVPTIEPYNEHDDIHFGDAGGGRAVAWVRFGETTDKDGKKVLVIDEIQSKRHQDAREKGYKDPELEKKISRMNELNSKMDAPEGISNEEYDELQQLRGEGVGRASFETSGVPAAPFERNWHELAMKRMLRYAAENGYDKIAWTKGEQQAERYNIGNTVNEIRWINDAYYNSPNGLEKTKEVILRLSGGDSLHLFVNTEGTIEHGTSELKGKSLSEVVGKEIANKIMENEGELGSKYYSLSGEGFRIGGEGMKGFYDQILPRFMDKYGKKWGVKVGEVELPDLEESAQKMWSVDVTPDMKASVMKGQPMFQKVSKDDGDKTLMGVHNISEEKLKKALKLGGLANPSLAVIDTKNGIHTDYGEISLIPRSTLIGAKTGRNAGTYAGDAWTPTYPNVERFFTKKGEKHISDIAKQAAGDDEDMMNHIESSIKNYIEGNGDRMHFLFLRLKGLNPKVEMQRTTHSQEEFDEIQKIFGDGTSTLPSYGRTAEQDKALLDLMTRGYKESVTKQAQMIKDESKREAAIDAMMKNKIESLVDQDGNLYFAPADTFVYDNWRDNERRKKALVDWYRTDNEADNRVATEGLAEEYAKWKDQLLSDEDIDERLFAGWTEDGHKRYLKNTVQNASRLMNKESETNAYNNGGLSASKAGLVRKLKTLSDIRKYRHLIKVGDDIKQELKEKEDEWFDIIQQVSDMQKIDDNRFINIDIAEARLQEAIEQRDPISYLNKEYGYNIEKDSELASDLMNFIETASELPVKYFETKFKRPVGIEEFAIAVVPTTTSPEVVKALKDAGLEVHTYEKGATGDPHDEARTKAVMDAVRDRDDIMFQKTGSPEPEMTSEERQYWKKWDDAMRKWKERNAIPDDQTEAPEKPKYQQGESALDFAQRLADWNRKHKIWQTAPKLEDFRQVRSDKDILEAARENEKRYPDSPSAKMRRIAAEMQRIRHAVSRQKTYDKATVKAVTDFAQDFMKMGFGDNLSRGEMERMLSSVKNATGAKDIKKEVDNIMNILIDNHLRNLDQRIQKLSSTKELSKTAQGVEKQGRLELKGQRMIQAFREAREQRMTEEQIRERMAEVAEKMNRNDEEAPMWEQEYEGLAIALQYAENIEGSRSEWADLDREYKDAVKGYKTSGRSYKDQQQLLESIEQAMQENKIDRIGYFGDIIGRLEGNISESMQGAKEFVERDKERVKHIQDLANYDLAGMDSGAMRENGKGKAANFFLQPLGTFEQMLKQFGSRNANGEGYLYDYFMRNWMDATNKAYLNEKKAKKELDAKARELFGDKVRRWSDLYYIERGLPTMDVEVLDGMEPKTFTLTQGNLLYIYMADKMNDGRMKLRKMGIDEDAVEKIKESLDPRIKALGDWLQEEYLPGKRTEYNKVHERMFGAPMAAIDNYFPLKVLGDARYQEQDVNVPDSETLPSTITGNIIKRRKNALPLDILHTDALSLAIEHIEDMERWAAQAEWNKDVNTLLSYTTFRNKVKNMKTVYGSGDALWNAFKDTAKMAAGTYDPSAKSGHVDKAISNIAKGVTAAKISFRAYTAFKQLLSAPAFLHDVRLDEFVKDWANPYGSWKWAMENMPVFEKRWKSRQVGDTRLMDDPSDWKMWKNDIVKMATRLGMSTNALVDGVTCAVGAKAIFESRYRRYKDIGASDEVARKRALQDAEIGYNLTQQSSEGAFVSAIQKDRTVAANMLSVFRNSSMSYTRQWYDAYRNLQKRTQKGYKDDAIKFMTRQMQEQFDLDEAQAKRAAELEYAREGRRDVARLLNMMFGVTVAWNLGASLPYLLIGDDDHTKKEMLQDALIKGLVAGPTEGFAAGNIWSDLMGRTVGSEQTRKALKEEGLGKAVDVALKQGGDYEVNPLPLMADIQSMFKKMGYDKFAAAQDLFNIVMQSAVGVNPQTFTDMWNAAMDYGAPGWDGENYRGDDENLSRPKELALFIMRFLNAPTSSWRNKYIDELGMNAEDAQKLPYEEMAKRYAHYKHWKDAPIMGWLRSDEARQKKMATIEKQFDKAVEERMQRLTDDELMHNVARSESAEEKRRYAKMIAQRLGVTPGDDSQKTTSEKDWYQNLYQQKMSYEDIREDEILADKYKNLENYFKEKREEAERKSVQDLKEFNEANKEWKDRIDEAKKEVKKRMDWIRGGKWSTPSGKKGNSKDATLQAPGKKQLETSDNPDEIMKNIRQWRKEALEYLMRAEQ